ncbi:MAG: bifunctional (p)ppGpp synthetase/guanosine-3',5'-bis(diphosphate) 3'-pyrophosphohydrolase [Erysipelotrichaceae bacterium]|nr:bifunctional (p)ppGpp synthetase/guanosine-3',5'-bis(diphosphate) 3'-pyrophosphohydrolase [Erysipelotrichaceae bacterium]
MKNVELTKEMFEEQIKSYIKKEDSLALIEKAYNYAKEKHEGQFRKSGEPYFVHIQAVAYELAKLHVGPSTICAGLLHDVIEDCDVTGEEFISIYGMEIYMIVEAVTKIGNLKFADEKEYQAANHRKILMAMAKDIRVILVKLCDRLHNMRTLEFMRPEKQKRIAKETLEVYAPIAHRLGLAEIKNELEDLCFYYLDNEKYREIAKLVENKKSERDLQVNQMIDDISKLLTEHNLPYRIFGRSKHLYSINKKMVQKGKRFEEILDLLAIRIITQTELNCYEILGYIHATYRPIPGRLKDYIAVPKMNMYRSLHTTIVGNDGRIYEIQIRTEEMDQVAEKGVAAHWAYKEGNYDSHLEQKEIVKELDWLKAFKEDELDNASNYMDTVIGDVFNANVYCMTPKGRVIDLPVGSNPIDFAYRIHTEVGHTTVGAIVNGALVPLSTVLKTGDVVEIRTNKNSTPSEDWLKIVKTTGAKNKIRLYFQKKEQEEKETLVKTGEEMLKQDMIKRGVDVEEYFDKEKLEKLFNFFRTPTYLDFMYSIAKKSLSTSSVIEKLVKLGKKELDEDLLQQIVEKNKSKSKAAHETSKSGVTVKGITGMKINLAPCCAPIYGDEIIGYVTKGQGIKVHRADCPNILKEKSRLISVEWDEIKPEHKFEANIKIFSKDRAYLLTDLITCISQFKANMLSVNISVNQEDLTATASLTLSVNDVEHLNTIMANLRKVNSVISVERAVK